MLDEATGCDEAVVLTGCDFPAVPLYFETFRLRRLFCQPNALNTAPNRTLQAAGFRYVKTLMTAPSPLNYRQPITRWVLEPGGARS